MSGSESERVIVLCALVDTALRPHARSFDRKNAQFREFVITGIEAPSLVEEEPRTNDRPDNGVRGTRRKVDSSAARAPRSTEIIRMGYGMTDQLDPDACPCCDN